MDNKSYIRDQVRKIKNRRVATSVIPKRFAEKRFFMATFLGCCILMLTLATFGGLIMKHGNVFADEPNRVTQNRSQLAGNRKPVQRIHQRDDALDKRMAAMESKVKLWIYRQWLMSLAVNENANLAKGVERSHHRNPNAGFITFDEEWRLSKIPETMKLSQKQRDLIRNGGR